MARREKIRLGQAVSDYIERCKLEDKSATSIESRQHVLGRMAREFGPNTYVHLIDLVAVERYAMALRNGKLAGQRGPLGANSFNHYRSILRSFFEWTVAYGYIDSDPMRGVQPAKVSQPKPRLMLSATDLLALLDHCTNPVERMACAVGMNTGLRAVDALRLTIFDVNQASGYVQTEIRKIRAFDGKGITADLGHELAMYYKEYARLAGLDGPEDLPSEWLLLPSYRGALPTETPGIKDLKPYTPMRNAYRLVQRPLERMGYPTYNEGFHTLRRSSARVLFEMLRDSDEGKDHALMIVKAFLNHKDTAQTEHYLGLDHERATRDKLMKGMPFLTAEAAREQAKLSAHTDQKVRTIGSWSA